MTRLTRRLRTLGAVSITSVLASILALGALPAYAQSTGGSTASAPRALSLDEALRMAETGSEEITVARAGVQRARGEQLRARSELFPQLYGNASYTRTLRSEFQALADNAPPADPNELEPKPNPTNPALAASCRNYLNAGGTIDQQLAGLDSAARCSGGSVFDAFRALPFGQANTWRLGLSVSQNVFAGGRIVAQTRAAAAGRRSAEVGLASARAQLLMDVTQAYYDAALTDRLVGIAEATLEQTERALQQTQVARQVGNQPEFELLRAQVTRDNQRPVLIQRRADRDIAYLRLKQLLNLSPDQTVRLTTGLGDSVEVAPTRLASRVRADGAPIAIDTATADRAPVRQAEAGAQVQEAALAIARAQRLPALSITSSYGRVAYPQGGVPTDWNEYRSNWTIGASLSLPLFTGGRIRGDELVAQANVTEARSRLEQTRELAQLDTRNALARLEAAQASFEASGGTTQQAGRAYQIAEIRFREGISTQLELTESRILLQQAQANRALAVRDLRVATARVALIRDLPISLGGNQGGAGTQGGVRQGEQQQQRQQQPPQQAAGGSQAFTGSAAP